MSRKHESIIKRIIKSEGGSSISVEQGRGHLKVKYTSDNGDHLYFTGNSPSDHRWQRKFTADIRRTMKGVRA